MKTSHTFPVIALLLGFLFLSPDASAAAAGTYVIDGGGYRIEVEEEGNNVVVVEPNKRSVYVLQSDGTFHYRDDTSGVVYGLRWLNQDSIEAFKPGSTNPATLLRRQGSAGAPTGADVADAQKYATIAMKYVTKISTDPREIQINTTCAAVAHQRSITSRQEADVYAMQAKLAITPILVNPTQNPCPDVFLQW